MNGQWWHPATQQRLWYSGIRAAHPDTSFPAAEPADLSHLGYYRVEPIDPPAAPTPQDEVVEGPPEEYTPGRWRQTWIIQSRPAPEDAIIDAALRRAVRRIPLDWST
jgi:hypothetical protein